MPIVIDSFNKLVTLTSPTTDVDAQVLHDTIENYMASPLGMIEDGLFGDRKGDILAPEGKIEDPNQPGVFSQIILIFSPEWQIQFWGGSGYTRIFGAKIVGGVGDEPFKASGTAGDITVLESPVDGLVVQVGGSALLPAESLQLGQIHGQIRRCVFLDTESIVNGNGYQHTPWNNWSDAVDDAEALSLQKIEIASDATLDRNLSNFTIVGINLPTVDLAGFDCNNAIFNQVTLTGAQGTGNSPLLALVCNVIAVTDFNGSMLTVSVVSSISIADGAFCLINEVIPAVGGVPWTLDMGAGGAASTVQVQNISGGLIITNMDNASDSAHFAFGQGAITIDASCTAGNIVLSGSVKVTDNSGVGCTVDDSAVDHEMLMDHVMENGETFEGQTRLIRAAAAGDIVQQPDGSYIIKSADGATDRITGDDAANSGRTISATDPT